MYRLRDIAEQFQNWVKNRCQKWGAPILDAPEGRRDDFVDPYFKHAKKDQMVVILKAREPARIMIAIGAENRWHLVKFQQRYEKRHGNYAAGRVSVSRSLVRPILNAGNLRCSKAAPSNLKSCSFRFDNERIPVQSCTRCGIQWENPKNWLLPIIGGCHVDIRSGKIVIPR